MSFLQCANYVEGGGNLRKDDLLMEVMEIAGDICMYIHCMVLIVLICSQGFKFPMFHRPESLLHMATHLPTAN